MLYLTKHSRPDITNAVRELPKTMDKPTHSQYKEILQVIKSVPESKYKGLKMNPIAFLHLHGPYKHSVILTGEQIKTPESVSMGSLYISVAFQLHGKTKA